jgi:phosphoribosyl 1,2-cyclic phosphodiesterase
MHNEGPSMKVAIWGTRGSLASPGPETARYGGNTSCVEVRAADDTVVVLDAGTGLRPLSEGLASPTRRVDVLLTHLHMDHIQGLGFFTPLHQPGRDVHIWGPSSSTNDLRTRLTRYLSPPLFPVHLGDVACDLTLHEVADDDFEIGPFTISSAFVCHPDPTVGYRIREGDAVVTYLPDHEPMLGLKGDTPHRHWTSAQALAASADLLIHDAQYTMDEYAERVGWGHTAIPDAVRFAVEAGARRLVLFHHDPTHSDEDLDRIFAAAVAGAPPGLQIIPAVEGKVFTLGLDTPR